MSASSAWTDYSLVFEQSKFAMVMLWWCYVGNTDDSTASLLKKCWMFDSQTVPFL